MPKISRKFWFTFPTKTQVQRPVIWEMSRQYPDVVFDIRQASVQDEIGIMAVLLEGDDTQVRGAVEFCRTAGLQVDPIEKTVLEG